MWSIVADVVLIHPPTTFNRKSALQSFNPSIYPGYGMLYLAAFLLKNGYDVKVWNIPELYLDGVSEKDVLNRFSKTSRPPWIFAIELNWMQQSRGAIETAERLKRHYPGIPIIVGGVHASLFAREIAKKYSHCVDGVIRGEAELPFLDCVETIEAGKPLDQVSGLTLMTENEVLENPIAKVIDDIDEIPPYSLRKIGGNIGPVIPAINVCRGPCPMKCIYCLGPRLARYSARQRMICHSPDWIIEQISLLIEDGFANVCFLEDQWTLRSKHLYTVARALRKEGIGQKVDHVDLAAIPSYLTGDVLEELSCAGVTNIAFGVESGSQRVLNMARRNLFVSQIKDSIKASVKKGMVPLTYWMVGFPGETREDVEMTAHLIKDTIELGGVPRSVNTVIATLGTELYEHAVRYGVEIRMKSFEDYMAFSDTLANEYDWYPQLVTHQTEHFKVDEILEMAFLLKMLIRKQMRNVLRKLTDNENVLVRYHPHLNLEEVIKRFVGDTLKTHDASEKMPLRRC